MLALVDHTKLKPILNRLLNEAEFLSHYGVRSVSRLHTDAPEVGGIPRQDAHARIEYNPGKSKTGLFGGNSNWRGPIWMPTNYSLIQALEKYHQFLGDNFRIPVACANNQELNLREIALGR